MAPEGATAGADFLASADGTRLAYRSWPVSGAAITFAVVHGLGEHSGRYERFARGMARFQMGTYAVDLRGHGLSQGQRGHVDSWSQWVDDAAAFVRHVQELVPGEVVPLGHSFGGAVLLSTVLAGKVSQSRRFVLSSAALRLKVAVPAWKMTLGRVASRVTPRLSMSNEVDPGTVSRIPEVVEAYRTDPLVHSKISSRTYTELLRAQQDIFARAGEIRVPFLILAGTDDRLIDPQGSVVLHEKAPEMSELRLLEGRYHEPFNDRDDQEVFLAIADWLRK
ncbi:MAG TPA: lysophospholipase [Candidatus Micrarchaeaceae archaeon]|nr:lysophospholipase [Candidatus Baltobacterales bacterium]HVC77671.1 lysophospholipase [Candidatus Micrarchaeaceae archaeon]